MERVRRAKIVATLGPATDGHEVELVRAGLDVARLNFSHGTHVDHARRYQAVRAAAAEVGRAVAVMQDLQGPKIRVGSLVGGGPVRLVEGHELVITTYDAVGTAERVSCTYPHLASDVRPGDRVLLDDGRIRLSVLGCNGSEVRTRVEEGGPLGEHKGINLPGVAVSSPAITDKDRADMAFGLQELGVDFIALSFIRSTSTGWRPMVVSAESITASVPSHTALATSVASARVGVSSVTIDSSIWVAVMTGIPRWFARWMMRFCSIGTVSGASSTPRSPRATMTPSATCRMESRLSIASPFSSLTISGALRPWVRLRVSSCASRTSSAIRMNDSAT